MKRDTNQNIQKLRKPFNSTRRHLNLCKSYAENGILSVDKNDNDNDEEEEGDSFHI